MTPTTSPPWPKVVTQTGPISMDVFALDELGRHHVVHRVPGILVVLVYESPNPEEGCRMHQCTTFYN